MANILVLEKAKLKSIIADKQTLEKNAELPDQEIKKMLMNTLLEEEKESEVKEHVFTSISLISLRENLKVSDLAIEEWIEKAKTASASSHVKSKTTAFVIKHIVLER